MPSPLIISHRTQMGTMPENSLEGIEAAMHSGVDGIEIDVRQTADGEIVLMHDDSLLRVTGFDVKIKDLTIQELSEYHLTNTHTKNGSVKIPTLREVLHFIDSKTLLVIEPKESKLESRIAEILAERNNIDQCWVWCLDPEVIREIPSKFTHVPTWLSFGMNSPLSNDPEIVIQSVMEFGVKGITANYKLLNEDLIILVHSYGLQVAAWTVNEIDAIENLKSLNVDVICSDFPERIFNI